VRRANSRKRLSISVKRFSIKRRWRRRTEHRTTLHLPLLHGAVAIQALTQLLSHLSVVLVTSSLMLCCYNNAVQRYVTRKQREALPTCVRRERCVEDSGWPWLSALSEPTTKALSPWLFVSTRRVATQPYHRSRPSGRSTTKWRSRFCDAGEKRREGGQRRTVYGSWRCFLHSLASEVRTAVGGVGAVGG